MNRIQTSIAVLGIIGILSGQPAAISAQTTQLRITQLSEKDYFQQESSSRISRDERMKKPKPLV